MPTYPFSISVPREFYFSYSTVELSKDASGRRSRLPCPLGGFFFTSCVKQKLEFRVADAARRLQVCRTRQSQPLNVRIGRGGRHSHLICPSNNLYKVFNDGCFHLGWVVFMCKLVHWFTLHRTGPSLIHSCFPAVTNQNGCHEISSLSGQQTFSSRTERRRSVF